jgi:hypothetical protein
MDYAGKNVGAIEEVQVFEANCSNAIQTGRGPSLLFPSLRRSQQTAAAHKSSEGESERDIYIYIYIPYFLLFMSKYLNM